MHPENNLGVCSLDYKSSNHLGFLDLPTSVQNKVLRLLMIKMSPAPTQCHGPHKEVRGVPTPSALGLMGPSPPLPTPPPATVLLGLRPLPTPAMLGKVVV